MKGWVTNAPVTAMPAGSALRLQNWIVKPNGLHTRAGYDVHASGLAGPVTALIAFGEKLIAATATRIYDVSAGGVISSSVLYGYESGAWKGAVMANPSGAKLFLANGVNQPTWCDGATWRASVITGIAQPGRLMAPIHHMRRLFAIESQSTNVWYLPVMAVQGEARKLPMGPHLTEGGTIVGLASLKGDASIDQNDKLVAVSSEGEIVIYAGIDPDNADTWRHEGTWTLPKPIGDRPFMTIGGALGVITEKGLIEVPGGLPKPEREKVRSALSEPIQQAWAELARSRTADDAWIGHDSLSAELMLITVPRVGQSSRQLVFATGAWSEWIDLDVTSVAETPSGLYFGRSDGSVIRYGAALDGDRPIKAVLADGFQRVGGQARKNVSRVRPQFTGPQPYRPYMRLLADYRMPSDDVTARYVADRYWMWDEVTWPMQPAQWGKDISSTQRLWRGISARAQAVSLHMAVQTRVPLIYTGADVMFTKGDGV